VYREIFAAILIIKKIMVLIKTFYELLNPEAGGATHHLKVVTWLIYQ